MLTVIGNRTGQDAWSFTVTGVTAAVFTVDYGDGTPPVDVTVHVSGTTVLTRVYTVAGHHDYVATFTAAVDPLDTLQEIADEFATLQALAIDPEYPTLASIPRNVDEVTVPVSVDVGLATIAATLLDASPVPHVQLDLVMSDPVEVVGWRVYRDVPGRASVLVWLGETTSGAFTLVDIAAPLGVDITYRLEVDYADATHYVASSDPVAIVGVPGCYLTRVGTGQTLRITLQAWPSRTRAARHALVEVLNRPDPVGLIDGHATPSGRWTLYTATDSETASLTSLLVASGAVVALRTQPQSSIVDCTAIVGDVVENRYNERDGTDQRRLVDVAIQEIESLPGTVVPSPATLDDLATLGAPSLSTLAGLRSTLLQLSQVQAETAAV